MAFDHTKILIIIHCAALGPSVTDRLEELESNQRQTGIALLDLVKNTASLYHLNYTPLCQLNLHTRKCVTLIQRY